MIKAYLLENATWVSEFGNVKPTSVMSDSASCLFHFQEAEMRDFGRRTLKIYLMRLSVG